MRKEISEIIFEREKKVTKKEKLVPKLFQVVRAGYTAKDFGKDAVAGVIVAIIALPLSIALALASGVNPENGIYTAIIAGFLISFFGGSRVQIAGPTAAFATIVAGIVAKDGMEGLMMATIIAGILLIVMGIFRVGSLIKFIPFTITTGFTAGIAVTIVIGQLKDFFGLTYAEGVKPIETMEKLHAAVDYFNTVNWHAALLGVICLLILFVWPRFNQSIPSSLIAVVVGILLVKFCHMNVNTIGDLYTISNQLPSFHMPHFSIALVQHEFTDGFTIAILAAIESLLSCVVADSMINSNHNSNQELIAQGIGNIGSVLFGGIPATGAIARTAANIKNGGRSPFAGMIHAVVLVFVLVLLMPYAALIPMPTIAAILFQVAYNMSGLGTCWEILVRAPKSDIIIFVSTLALTIVFDLVVAIEFGMVAACILFMKRMSEEAAIRGWVDFDELDEDDPDRTELKQIPKHISVYEISGPLFFGAVDLLNEISAKSYTKVLIIRMRAVPAIDVSAMRSLENLIKRCKKKEIALIFSHVNDQPYRALEKSGLVEMVGEENILPHLDDAIERAIEITAESAGEEK